MSMRCDTYLPGLSPQNQQYSPPKSTIFAPSCTSETPNHTKYYKSKRLLNSAKYTETYIFEENYKYFRRFLHCIFANRDSFHVQKRKLCLLGSSDNVFRKLFKTSNPFRKWTEKHIFFSKTGKYPYFCDFGNFGPPSTNHKDLGFNWLVTKFVIILENLILHC